MEDTMNATVVAPANYLNDWPLSWEIIRFVLGILEFVGSILSFMIIIGILLTNARKKGYNLYLVFLVIPDAIFNVMCSIRNICFATNDGKAPVAINFIWFWSMYFYFFANGWQIVVVMIDVYFIVKQSFARHHVAATSQHVALVKSFLVLLFSAVYATWNTLEVHWSPRLNKDKIRGIWAVNGKLKYAQLVTMIIPLSRMIIILCIVWKRKILPTSGKTRIIYLYTRKIFFSFFAFYIPIYAIAYVVAFLPTAETKFWVQTVTYTLMHMQALMTLYFVMSKNDVYEEVNKFYSPCFQMVHSMRNTSSRSVQKQEQDEQKKEREEHQGEWEDTNVYDDNELPSENQV